MKRCWKPFKWLGMKKTNDPHVLVLREIDSASVVECCAWQSKARLSDLQKLIARKHLEIS